MCCEQIREVFEAQDSLYSVRRKVEVGDDLSWEIQLIDAYHILADIHLLKVTYNISNHFYNTYLFEDDCVTPFTSFSMSNEVISYTSGFKTIEVTMELTQEFLDNTSVISQNEISTNVDFCILVDLYTDEEKSIRPTFLETVIHLNVFAGFQIVEIDVDRFGPINKTIPDIDYDNLIDSYLCDENQVKIAEPLPLPQGSLIYICVENLNPSAFTVTSIYELGLFQDPIPPSLTGVSFDAIDKGQSNIAFVVTDCVRQKNICFVKMQLIADFFESEDPTPIFVSGAIVISGTSTVDRYLETKTGDHEGKNQRYMVEDNTDIGRFDLSLEITNDIKPVGLSEESSGWSLVRIIRSPTILIGWFSVLIIFQRRDM